MYRDNNGPVTVACVVAKLPFSEIMILWHYNIYQDMMNLNKQLIILYGYYHSIISHCYIVAKCYIGHIATDHSAI